MVTTNRNILFKATILALCIISLVHVYVFPLYDNGKKDVKHPGTTYGDLEPTLCMNNFKKRKVWRLNTNCPSDVGIVTVIQGGRLGNQMWEYASVWGVARRTGLDPYVPRCIKVILNQVFDDLSIPDFDEIANCPILSKNFVRKIDNWTSVSQNIILRKYVTNEIAVTWPQDLRQEFKFNKKLRDKSQQILRGISAKFNRKDEPTFVSVHIRRTDYIKYLKDTHDIPPADISFYRKAMDYFDMNYNSPIFVFLSDEPKWCSQKFGHLKNIYVASKNNPPALDMAIMAACNHSIYDYGTFGEWGAILAGGETIFYYIKDVSSTRVSKILNNWHPMTNKGMLNRTTY